MKYDSKKIAPFFIISLIIIQTFIMFHAFSFYLQVEENSNIDNSVEDVAKITGYLVIRIVANIVLWLASIWIYLRFKLNDGLSIVLILISSFINIYPIYIFSLITTAIIVFFKYKKNIKQKITSESE